MTMLEIDKRRTQRLMRDYCQRCLPPHARGQVRLDFTLRGRKVTLIEARPVLQQPDTWSERKIAQFEFDPEHRTWRLYCYDRNARRRAYYLCEEEAQLEKLLLEVDADPSGIFWG